VGEIVYWIVLVLCCMPLYLAIAWAFFGDRENAKDSFGETIVTLLKLIFIPGIVRVMMGMDDEDSLSFYVVGLFIAGCIGLTWGIHLGVQKFFG
jgi:hypothetical protein